MRKLSKVMFLTLLSLILIASSAYAITGQCSNCHTMHNSQNGVNEVQIYNGSGALTTGVATPQQYLLKANCIGCHTGSSVATSPTNSFGAPIVLQLTCPSGQGGTSTLAGGDFCFVAAGIGAVNSHGHNVAGLAVQEGSPMDAPPGFDAGATASFAFGQIGGGTWTAQLTCAGTNGCHGMHNSTGITGAHHSNTGGTANKCDVADTVGNSYRFLAGIKGLENATWNYNESASNHNEYYGANTRTGRSQTNTSYADTSTISFSCAECHGYFHSKIDDSTDGSPWLRHPTDVSLATGTEEANYNPDNSHVYSTQAPVGRTTVPSSGSDGFTAGSDVVTCISCHRAHGSPEPDMLRWTYNMQAGVGTTDTGCFVCHTGKNAD